MRKLLWGLVLAGSLGGSVVMAQMNSAAPRYVDENGTDPAPIKLNGLEGKVQGLGGEPMPHTQVALFTEDGHALVGSMMTDKEGKFKFNKVEHGSYRVVARSEGLCPANIPVKVGGSMFAHHTLVITMQPKDIDTCSYGSTK